MHGYQRVSASVPGAGTHSHSLRCWPCTSSRGRSFSIYIVSSQHPVAISVGLCDLLIFPFDLLCLFMVCVPSIRRSLLTAISACAIAEAISGTSA